MVLDPAGGEHADSATNTVSVAIQRLWARLFRRPLAIVGGLFLTLVIVSCALAEIIAPYGSDQADFAHASEGPSLSHLLGTDTLGRDILSRLLYGGQETLVAVAVGVVVAAVIGIPLGLLAGFKAGWWDRSISWVQDLLLALPSMILLLAVLAVFPHNTVAAMIVLGVLISAGLARVVRSATLGVRSEQYVDAARVAGIGEVAIIRTHVVSKVIGPIIVQLSLLAAVFLLTETGLGFLGLGPQPPTPSWGSLVGDASAAIQTNPWMLIPTGGTVVLTALACGLVGDGLRESLGSRWGSGVHSPPQRSLRRKIVSPTETTVHSSHTRPLLEVRGITVEFPAADGPVTVIRDVSFEISAGEAIALVGESGSGKSVTAKAVLGLLPSGGQITEGEVLLDGELIAGAHAPKLNGVNGKRVAMISQAPQISLDPTLRVGRLLTDSIRRHTGRNRSAAITRAEELLSLVGIPDPSRTMRRYPHELSGGMAQRVGIARALSGDPDLLLADEPTTALDVTVQAEILELLRELQERLDLAVLFVTHDWGVVADLAQRCVVMYAGEVVETASVEDIFTRPRHPYTRGLIKSNPYFATPGANLPTLRGRVPMPAEWPIGCHFANRCPIVVDECRSHRIALEPIDADRSSRCIRHEELLQLPPMDAEGART